jgi:hypothetical protein
MYWHSYVVCTTFLFLLLGEYISTDLCFSSVTTPQLIIIIIIIIIIIEAENILLILC